MTKIGMLLNKNKDQCMTEDTMMSLSLYNEMATFSSKDTGIEIKNKRYNTVLPNLSGQHGMRIKFSVKPNTSDGSFLINIFQKDNNLYKVMYTSSIKEYVDSNKDAIKLAVVFYDKNKISIHNFIDKISNNKLVTQDEIDEMRKLWIKVNKDDLKSSIEVEYEHL